MSNKHVISDLYQMQSLPLNAKISMTQRRIREWVDEYGEDGVYMLRYAKYGYFPCKETKMKIINALRDLTDEQVELSESLYDGMD